MGRGLEPIADALELAAVRSEARRVLVRSAIGTVALTAATLLLP
jgi:hypothetical protein